MYETEMGWGNFSSSFLIGMKLKGVELSLTQSTTEAFISIIVIF